MFDDFVVNATITSGYFALNAWFETTTGKRLLVCSESEYCTAARNTSPGTGTHSVAAILNPRHLRHCLTSPHPLARRDQRPVPQVESDPRQTPASQRPDEHGPTPETWSSQIQYPRRRPLCPSQEHLFVHSRPNARGSLERHESPGIRQYTSTLRPAPSWSSRHDEYPIPGWLDYPVYHA